MSGLEKPTGTEKTAQPTDSTSADEFDRQLELSGRQFQELVEQVTVRLVPFLDSLPKQPAWDTDDVDPLLPLVEEQLPANGRPLEEILSLLFESLIPKGFNTTSPG